MTPEDSDPPEVTFVLVLRSGGEYTIEHVKHLARNILDHAPATGWSILLLSDAVIYVGSSASGGVYARSRSLTEGWPGWWSKMEMFRLPGPCVYLDLDTIVVGDLRWILDIARTHEFTMLRDAYRGRTDPLARQSSVMTWSGDMSRLHAGFSLCGVGTRPTGPLWSDQNWIETAEAKITALQDLAPGKLVSFKVDCHQGPAPAGASIVYFHGRPRPWQQEAIPYGSQ